MTDPAPPSWVRKRDGRLAPFEADRISRALFAATEGLGKADAFLARELADSVVHFLAQDSGGETPTTQRVAEVVEQTLRELGQAPLARAFAEHGRQRPRRPADESLAAVAREWAQAVYTRDLAAAQDDGLIVLTGHQTPGELAGCVLGDPVTMSDDLAADLHRARRLAGQFVALDGLEHLAAGGRSIADLARQVALGLERTGLYGVVNLNVAAPPSWADPLATGPLFADGHCRPSPGRLRELADELFAEFARLNSSHLRIDWHLSADDFADTARLSGVVEAARDGDVCFVCDRPRRPVALAEGLDRRHPAALVLVGLNLPALLRQPGMLADEERYRQRLGSLVRLGLSAAVQKRDFVRRADDRRIAEGGPTVKSAFLLDRARFVAVPVGLDEVVRQMTGWGLCSGGASLELGKRIVRRLREVLDQEARLAQMDACLDGACAGPLAGASGFPAAGASPRSQIRAAGVLHAVAEHGTLSLQVDADEAVHWLDHAWRQTEVVRIRLC